MFRRQKSLNGVIKAVYTNYSEWLVTQHLTVITHNQYRNCNVPASMEPFINSHSTEYLDHMYISWLSNPKSVHESWNEYFQNLTSGSSDYQHPSYIYLGKNEVLLRSLLPLINRDSVETEDCLPSQDYVPSKDSLQDENKNVDDHLALQSVIATYQIHGHLMAKLDPLNIGNVHQQIVDVVDVQEKFNIMLKQLVRGKSDLNRVFRLPPSTFIGGEEKALPLREIISRLGSAYCRHIGVEYAYLHRLHEVYWIREKFESPNRDEFTNEQKKLILSRLIRSIGFENFLARKYPSEKRFGLEGCDMLIAAMKAIIDKCSEGGVQSFIMGMPHRGRLNVLANVCRKPLHQIFTQFASLKASDVGSGDVKYHLGTFVSRLNRLTNKTIKLAIVANPSHLEVVCPIAEGKTKAEQVYSGDKEGKKSMCILLHGDAAFAGQGIVFETIHLSALPEYTTHGTIHIVVNNQVGFTTDPRFSRSSPYCTDAGRIVYAPILHVNADFPEDVIRVCNIAAEWRTTFQKDVIIDLVCYRRKGHNEADEPMFTQPLIYQTIKSKLPCLEKYSTKLIDEGVITEAEIKHIQADYDKICEDAFEISKLETNIQYRDWIDSPWKGFFRSRDYFKINPTGVKKDVLMHIGTAFSSPPPKSANFVIHSGITRILKLRSEMLAKEQVDWAIGEAMAFGSLLKEGIHVRLSGQDVERGTFSHRHHVLHHQTVDKAIFNPLNNLFPDQALYKVCNSSLCEYGILSFEVGYSITNPNSLVIWEAQFGDFANVAQAVIDTVIASGQSKWIRHSGLVCYLPHGMEGQGPEHSSARLERYLQLSSDDPDTFPPEGPDFVRSQLDDINWIVANCTTPANLFHILRRQLALPFRKPLILMTPKSLLRHPEARSSLNDMIEGTEFQRVIPDNGPAQKSPKAVQKLIFCTGKVFYDIKKSIREQKIESNIAVARIEQITPFPFDLIKAECAKYPNAKIVWLQEEHKNQGAWPYVQPRFDTVFAGQKKIIYVGRPTSASTATGSKPQYIKELAAFLGEATKLDKKS